MIREGYLLSVFLITSIQIENKRDRKYKRITYRDLLLKWETVVMVKARKV